MSDPAFDALLPPPEPIQVYRIGAAGVVGCLIAALLSLVGETEPGLVNTLQLVLVFGGCLAAGSALSMRPSLPLAWGLTAIAFLLALAGLPAHWDSFRYVAIVGAAVGLAGMILTACPQTIRRWALSIIALIHFGAIFCAVTWPDPSPWSTVQIGTRIYLPYMKFMYLQNAYHFYSPEPGPASLVYALVKFDKLDAKGKPEAEWVTLPTRREHLKDPLGLSYYRRLSITEQVSQAMPPMTFTFEANEVSQRRQRAAGLLGGIPDYPKIPIAPAEFESFARQYLPPRPDISRYLLPSYANHILKHEVNGEPGRKPVSVKIYRLEHRVTPPSALVQKVNPHHPVTFRPYYLGEFQLNAAGKAELIDPQDPLLYWLVPILPMPASPGDPEQKDFKDYMSEHAGYSFDWGTRKP